MKFLKVIFLLLICFQSLGQQNDLVVSFPNTSILYAGFENKVQLGFTQEVKIDYKLSCENCAEFKETATKYEYIIRTNSTDKKLKLRVIDAKGIEIQSFEYRVFQIPKPYLLINSAYTSEDILDTIPVILSLHDAENVPVNQGYRVRQIRFFINSDKEKTWIEKGPFLSEGFKKQLSESKKGTLTLYIEYERFDSPKKMKLKEIIEFDLTN